MKRIIGIIFIVMLLSGCATARVAGTVGDDIKNGNEVSSASESDTTEMMGEWFDVLIGVVSGAAGL